MSEVSKSEKVSAPNPAALAELLKGSRKQVLGNVAVTREAVVATNTEEERHTPDNLPATGKEFMNGSGQELIFVPAYKHIRNPRTGQYDRKQYTLRDYFSHTAADGVNGPGWDMRMGLLELSDEAMRTRYGHVFSREEVIAPQKMPETPFYDVVSKEEYEEMEQRGLL